MDQWVGAMEYQDDDGPTMAERMGPACPWCGSPLKKVLTDEAADRDAGPSLVCSKHNDPDCAYPWLDLDADLMGIHAAEKAIESGALPPGWWRVVEKWRRDIVLAGALLNTGQAMVDAVGDMANRVFGTLRLRGRRSR